MRIDQHIWQRRCFTFRGLHHSKYVNFTSSLCVKLSCALSIDKPDQYQKKCVGVSLLESSYAIGRCANNIHQRPKCKGIKHRKKSGFIFFSECLHSVGTIDCLCNVSPHFCDCALTYY